ncbi:DNA primase catalytic core, N-terminal domain [Nocardioides sp. JS614]|nr:DNA primase catalytic core, N-terminal domain [Nocardioides sp. JS614]
MIGGPFCARGNCPFARHRALEGVVMSLRKLTAGDGYSYLTRQVAAHDTTEKGHTSLADYYDEKGESPGRWMGSGLTGLGMNSGQGVTAQQMKALYGLGIHPDAANIEERLAEQGASRAEVEAAIALGKRFPIHDTASTFNVRVAEAFTAYNAQHRQKWNAPIRPEERARIRTQIGTAMFVEGHGREPQDARELSGFIAKASRQPTSAVAGFDLTFSPVKSVSALWALAPKEVAADIRAAHDAAVVDTLTWLEREVAHTRVGSGGVRQVKVRGLVAAAFTHRDSRAGDPDLHTHVAVSNKVQAEDGHWLALDGRLLYAAKVTASEHYNTRVEAELVARLGVEFADRDDTVGGKVPVREIRGVSTTLTRWWSRRRVAIEARQAEIAAEFQGRFGRPPTAIEAKSLADQATLETRDAKHGRRSEREQRDEWRAEADDVLGDPAEVDEMYSRAVGRRNGGRTATRDWVEDVAAATIAFVEESRATWNVWHLLAEAQRQARRAGIARDDVDRAVDQVVDAAISRSVRLGVDDPISEPPPLQRPDGASVYDVHGATLYTSAKVLLAEEEILNLAGRTGGHALADVRVEVAIAGAAANGFELNDAQAAMARDLATSGAVVQLALAPAGTGKTTTMSVLADAWAAGGGQVIGLAPSAQAAHELGQAVSGYTDTLAKLTWTLANEPSVAWPRWIRDIGPQSLVIVDEAGQAATTELAAAVRFVAERGGAVRLIGDDQQLAAVGAGGVLRDIQQQYGASTLSEVRRFDDPAEAAATLAVREGDAAALGFYADNARIHVGDLSAVADQAYDSWASDRAAGLDSVLLAPTRELVCQLNARARADRLTATATVGPEVDLADGNRGSVGDVIVTRRNSRRLVVSRSNWVKNGDRWRIEKVLGDGGLLARHLELGRTVELPLDYVAQHVHLGYATTVHGAQGMTADTAHLVAAGEETRQTLYVGISRGRQANHIYLDTGYDGDPHSLIDPKALRPPTAIDILAEILERDGSDRSATTTQREASAYTTQFHDAVMRYHDALGYAAEDVLGADSLASTNREVEAIWPGLTSEPAYPTLRGHLALRTVDGADPVATLLDAANERELGTSDDRAAVLDWRLGKAAAGPLPWLDGVPERLADHATWGPYLRSRFERITTLAGAVRGEAEAWTPTATPPWASGLTAAEHSALRGDLSVWRAAFDVPEDHARATGPVQPGASTAPHQQDLERRVRSVLGVHRADDELLELMPEEVRTDAEFGRLSERLGALQAAHVDVGPLMDRALNTVHPLPDERTADALWWRIVRHLGPAALRASANQAHTLRPSWTSHLSERLGEATCERVMADAMWPALVAAIHARPAEWTAEQLIDAATSGHGPDVRPEELCSALVWRIATMTDAPFAEPEPPEPDFSQPEPTPVAPIPAMNEPGAPAERIIELNHWALDHYSAMYPKSWAPDYLRDRLGNDLTDDPRYQVGYAPPGPTSLIQHLATRGTSEEELLDAGLARRTERGHLVDAFRDRLVFPIYSGSDLVGFIGRRNPTKPDGEFSGPKYLNTRSTAVFAKGEALFGLTEATADLDAGSTPVLVEGPMDAIAVTLASGGEYVGIAPLGTAFTETQAATLKPHLREAPSNIVIATDPDSAGWQSAQRAFWRLAALRAAPRHLTLPEGVDPADALRKHGKAALRTGLADSRDFALVLVDRVLDDRLATHDDAFARVDHCREAARTIGTLAPDRWLAYAQHASERLDLPLQAVIDEVLEAGAEWTDDPRACASRELARLGVSAAAPKATHRERVMEPPAATSEHCPIHLSRPPSPAVER